MAINKKLISFATQAQFTIKLNAGDIDNRSIVFIEDAKRIWTHGVYFDTSWNYVGDKPDTYTPSAHTHGPITNDGKIGTQTNRIIETTTGGLLTHVAKNTAYNKAFGTGVDQVARGNHTHAYLPLTGGTLTGDLTIKSAANTYLDIFTASTNQGNAELFLGEGSRTYGAYFYYEGTANVQALGSQASGNDSRVDAIKWGRGSANVEIVGTTTSSQFIRKGGTTTQFLKADGSVDSNIYITASSIPSEIPISEIDAGTSATLRTITGRRVKHILDKKSDSNHNHTLKLIAGISTATVNSTVDVANPYIRLFSDNVHQGNIQIVGGTNVGAVSRNGVVTLTATDTTYTAGTLALLQTGTNTSNRVWSSKILNDWLNPKLALKATPADIDTAIDNIEIGGRNLMLESKNFNIFSSNNGSTSPITKGIENGVNWITGYRTSTDEFFISTYITEVFSSHRGSRYSEELYPVPSELTFSLDVMSSEPIQIGLSTNNYVTLVPNEWTRISYTDSNVGARPSGIMAMGSNIPKGTKVYYRNYKIEKGNKATDWTPAPEDVQEEINLVQTNLDSHTSLTNNPHSVTKAQVGLGNVNNTSDANKPISTATQTALNGKLNLTGGTLSNSSFGGSLTIHRIATNNSTIKFTATSGNPWYIGMDVVTGEFGVVNSAVGITTSKVKLNGSSGLVTGTGFSKTGATDAHMLLGSGGHKAISDFVPKAWTGAGDGAEIWMKSDVTTAGHSLGLHFTNSTNSTTATFQSRIQSRRGSGDYSDLIFAIRDTDIMLEILGLDRRVNILNQLTVQNNEVYHAGNIPTWNQSTTGNAATASAVSTSAENSSTASRYILFANNASGNQALKTDSGLKYVPSTNTISATFSGNLTGNVTGNVTGSAGSTTNWAGNTYTNSNITNEVYLMTSTNGTDWRRTLANRFSESGHTHDYLPLTGGILTGDIQYGTDTGTGSYFFGTTSSTNGYGSWMTQNIKEVNGVLVKPRGTLASKALTINHHKGMTLFVDNRTGLAHGVTAELAQVFNVSTAGVITAASFSGNINASSLNTGTVPNARITGTYTGLTNLTGTGNVDFARFIGNAGDTVTAPSITWTGDLNTGIYRPGASQVAITTGGAQRALFNSSGVSFSGTTTVSGDINGTSATFSIKASGTDVFRMSGVNPVISTKSTGTIYLRPNGSSSSVNEVTINSAGIKVGTTNVSLDGHTHSYLPLSGGTLTGNLQVTGSTLRYGKTYTKYFNSVSTESNSRNEIRIPMYSTSGAMFLNIEASVDTTSVGTEYYIKKNFRLRNYQGQSVGTIYGQSTNVIETYGDHYYHIGDAEPDTVNQMWIIPIYSSNNRQVSVKMTAWGTDAVSQQILSSTIHNNVETGIIIPERQYATFDGNASSATKLSSSRTIWGQSFDGTGNVSGALTGVTNITATGTVTAPTFSGALSGNASTVTNGVYTNNTQTISGAKTFSNVLKVHRGMSDYASAFTSPHITLSAAGNTDNTGFVGISYATSSSDNYGWTVGSVRSTNGNGDFVFKNHVNNAAGAERVRISGSGTVTAPTFSGSLSGNASSATYASTVTLTADNSTNATRYPLFVDAATGNKSPRTDTGFTYNPSTGILTSTSFAGSGASLTSLNATQLTTGTIPDARLAGIYTGFTHRIDGANTIFTTPSAGTSNTSARTAFGVAEYRGSGSAVTGAIVFIAPFNSTTMMKQMEIEGMLHSPSNVVKIIINNYNTGLRNQINLGSLDIPVRIGQTADSKFCVILGDVTTSWSYPHFTLSKVMMSHSSVSDVICYGWSVKLETDLTGYLNVYGEITNSPIVTDITGNATTATTLATTRAINGTNFNGSAAITTARWGTARNISIGGTSKSVNGSANVTWATSEIAAQSAVQLATTRTIWGQNFNGTGNVSGALSGATTGSFSSTLSADRIVVTSTSNVNHLEFSRSDYNYITSPGHIGFITGGTVTGSANQQVWIHSNGNTKIGAGNSSAPAYTLDVNGTGRFAGTVTAPTFEGTATNANTINTLADNSSNASRFILFSDAATGNQRAKTDTGLKYNPSSNTITATLAGNASSATKLASITTTFTGTYPVTFNVNGDIYSHTGITYTGSTNTLTTTNFIGNLTGLASLNLPIAGGTMTGVLTAQNNTSYTTKQVRNIILSPSAVNSSAMGNGDIWITYE